MRGDEGDQVNGAFGAIIIIPLIPDNPPYLLSLQSSTSTSALR